MATHSSIFACRTPWTAGKGKDMMPVDETHKLEGVQHATGEEWKAITNSSSKNEAAETKWEQHSVVDVSGGESKIWCCKE